MSSEVVREKFGPIAEYPPFRRLLEKRDRNETVFKVMSVAIGMIGVGGSLAGGIVLIVTGAQGSSLARILSGSFLIPVGLPVFAIAAVENYRNTRDHYRSTLDTCLSIEQAQEAFRARGGPRRGEIDTPWKSFLAYRPRCLGTWNTSEFFHATIPEENQDLDLSDDWREVLHNVSWYFDKFLFIRGFYGKRWAGSGSGDPSTGKLNTPLLCTREEIDSFFNKADTKSYTSLLKYLNNVDDELLKQHPDMMRALLARPPRAEEVKFFSLEFVQKVIGYSEEGSEARSAWERILQEVIELEGTEPERIKAARIRALAKERDELKERLRVVQGELYELTGIVEVLREIGKRTRERAALQEQRRAPPS